MFFFAFTSPSFVILLVWGDIFVFWKYFSSFSRKYSGEVMGWNFVRSSDRTHQFGQHKKSRSSDTTQLAELKVFNLSDWHFGRTELTGSVERTDDFARTLYPAVIYVSTRKFIKDSHVKSWNICQPNLLIHLKVSIEYVSIRWYSLQLKWNLKPLLVVFFLKINSRTRHSLEISEIEKLERRWTLTNWIIDWNL